METLPQSGPGRLAFALASYATTASQSEYVRVMLDHLPVIAFRIDSEGRISESSGKAREALVSSRGDSRGQLVSEAYADVPDVLQAIARAQAGESVELTVEVAQRQYRVAYQPAPDGSVLGVAFELQPLAPSAGTRGLRGGPRVLVVEPRERLRAGLAAQLEERGAHTFAVASAEDTMQVLARGDAARPDVVVLGEGAGAEPLLRVRAAYPDLRTLVLIPRPTPATVGWWQERGAHGVLGAYAPGTDLIEAVNIVARYGAFVADASHLHAVSGAVLTPRERQVACLLARDLSRDAIAAEMGIAPGTASVLTSRARASLGVTTNVGLALHAVREGWVSVDGLRPE